MVGTLVAISGISAAAPSARADAAPTAVEISFITRAGEGAAGRTRFTRDGCYRAESGGSTGGSRGPLRPVHVARVVVERFATEMKPLSPACAGR